LPVLLPADVPDPLATFHNHGSVARRTAAVQKRLNAALGGTATGGSNRRLVVAGRDWDALDFWAPTNGKTHTFTPSTGGTTSCTVPGVSGSDLVGVRPVPGFLRADGGVLPRGVAGADASFSDPDAVIDKRIIATGTTGGAITWAEATSASSTGSPAGSSSRSCSTRGRA
jgi:hypothetical protein